MDTTNQKTRSTSDGVPTGIANLEPSTVTPQQVGNTTQYIGDQQAPSVPTFIGANVSAHPVTMDFPSISAKDIHQRKFFLKSVDWSSTAAPGTSLMFQDLRALCLEATQRTAATDQMRYAALLRADFRFFISTAETPLGAGQLIMVHGPPSDQTVKPPDAYVDPMYRDLRCLKTYNHVCFRPNETQEVSFFVPYTHWASHVFHPRLPSQYDQPNGLGFIHLLVWNSLRSPEPAVVNSLSVQIYYQFENVDMIWPSNISSLTAQMLPDSLPVPAGGDVNVAAGGIRGRPSDEFLTIDNPPVVIDDDVLPAPSEVPIYIPSTPNVCPVSDLGPLDPADALPHFHLRQDCFHFFPSYVSRFHSVPQSHRRWVDHNFMVASRLVKGTRQTRFYSLHGRASFFVVSPVAIPLKSHYSAVFDRPHEDCDIEQEKVVQVDYLNFSAHTRTVYPRAYKRLFGEIVESFCRKDNVMRIRMRSRFGSTVFHVAHLGGFTAMVDLVAYLAYRADHFLFAGQEIDFSEFQSLAEQVVHPPGFMGDPHHFGAVRFFGSQVVYKRIQNTLYWTRIPRIYLSWHTGVLNGGVAIEYAVRMRVWQTRMKTVHREMLQDFDCLSKRPPCRMQAQMFKGFVSSVVGATLTAATDLVTKAGEAVVSAIVSPLMNMHLGAPDAPNPASWADTQCSKHTYKMMVGPQDYSNPDSSMATDPHSVHVRSLARAYSRLDIATWDASADVGKLLWSTGFSPGVVPGLGVLGSSFRLMRGSFDFQIEVVRNALHKGKLVAVIFPNAIGSVPSTLSSFQDYYSYVLDLAASDTLAFRIPHMTPEEWYSYSDETFFLALYVVSPLTTRFTISTVDVNIYCSTGPDFDVCMPTAVFSAYRGFVSQGVSDVTPDPQAIQSLKDTPMFSVTEPGSSLGGLSKFHMTCSHGDILQLMKRPILAMQAVPKVGAVFFASVPKVFSLTKDSDSLGSLSYFDLFNSGYRTFLERFWAWSGSLRFFLVTDAPATVTGILHVRVTQYGGGVSAEGLNTIQLFNLTELRNPGGLVLTLPFYNLFTTLPTLPTVAKPYDAKAKPPLFCHQFSEFLPSLDLRVSGVTVDCKISVAVAVGDEFMLYNVLPPLAQVDVTLPLVIPPPKPKRSSREVSKIPADSTHKTPADGAHGEMSNILPFEVPSTSKHRTSSFIASMIRSPSTASDSSIASDDSQMQVTGGVLGRQAQRVRDSVHESLTSSGSTFGEAAGRSAADSASQRLAETVSTLGSQVEGLASEAKITQNQTLLLRNLWPALLLKLSHYAIAISQIERTSQLIAFLVGLFSDIVLATCVFVELSAVFAKLTSGIAGFISRVVSVLHPTMTVSAGSDVSPPPSWVETIVGLVKSWIAPLLLFFSSFELPWDSLRGLLRDMTLFGTAHRGFSCIFQIVRSILEWLFSVFSSFQTPEEIQALWFDSHQVPICSWERLAVYLLGNFSLSRFATSEVFFQQVADAWEFGQEFLINTTHLSKNIAVARMRDLAFKMANIHAKMPVSVVACVRQEPVVLWLCGNPGSGKSLLAMRLAKAIAKKLAGDENSVFSVTSGTKYWTTYSDQAVVVMDDVFQTTAKCNSADSDEMSNFCQMISSVPFNPPMADIVDKSIFFNSKLVICTSNMLDPPRDTFASPEAARRRYGNNAYEVTGNFTQQNNRVAWAAGTSWAIHKVGYDPAKMAFSDARQRVSCAGDIAKHVLAQINGKKETLDGLTWDLPELEEVQTSPKGVFCEDSTPQWDYTYDVGRLDRTPLSDVPGPVKVPASRSFMTMKAQMGLEHEEEYSDCRPSTSTHSQDVSSLPSTLDSVAEHYGAAKEEVQGVVDAIRDALLSGEGRHEMARSLTNDLASLYARVPFCVWRQLCAVGQTGRVADIARALAASAADGVWGVLRYLRVLFTRVFVPVVCVVFSVYMVNKLDRWERDDVEAQAYNPSAVKWSFLKRARSRLPFVQPVDSPASFVPLSGASPRLSPGAEAKVLASIGAWRVAKGAEAGIVNAMRVGGQVLMVPRHGVRPGSVHQFTQNGITYDIPITEENHYAYCVKAENGKQYLDVAFVYASGVPAARNISSYFWSDAEQTAFVRGEGTALLFHNGKFEREESVFGLHGSTQHVDAQSVMNGDPDAVLPWTLLAGTDVSSRKGHCGSPLVLRSDRLCNPLVGMLSGQVEFTSVNFTPVTREMIAEAMAHFAVTVQGVELTPPRLEVQYSVDARQLERPFFLFDSVCESTVFVPESRLDLSPLAAFNSLALLREKQHFPARLSPRDFESEEKVELAGESIPLIWVSQERPQASFDPATMERAVSLVSDSLVSHQTVPLRVFSVSEALHGVEESVLERFADGDTRRVTKPLDVTTSAGIGFPQTKREMVIFDEGNCPVALKPDIAVRYEQYLEKLKQGIVPDDVFAGFPKDELRTEEKVVAGKTRLFFMPPFFFLLACRQYFGDFCAEFRRMRGFLGHHLVGCDALREWDGIGRFWSTSRVLEYDVSQWDQSVSPFLLDSLRRILEMSYRGTEEDRLVRAALFHVIAFTSVQIGRLMFVTVGGVKSGIVGTGEFNSVIHILAIFYSLLRLRGEFYLPFVPFLVYGDDGLVELRGISISEFVFEMGSLGFRLTHPLYKSLLPEEGTIEEVAILKRRFRAIQVSGCVAFLPDISMDTILGILEWKRPTSTLSEHYLAGLRFLFEAGRRPEFEMLRALYTYWTDIMRDQRSWTWERFLGECDFGGCVHAALASMLPPIFPPPIMFSDVYAKHMGDLKAVMLQWHSQGIKVTKYCDIPEMLPNELC